MGMTAKRTWCLSNTSTASLRSSPICQLISSAVFVLHMTAKTKPSFLFRDLGQDFQDTENPYQYVKTDGSVAVLQALLPTCHFTYINFSYAN
jgi:hypothetical protein